MYNIINIIVNNKTKLIVSKFIIILYHTRTRHVFIFFSDTPTLFVLHIIIVIYKKYNKYNIQLILSS